MTDQPTTDNGGQLVPFGKHKGKPVEVMFADPGYRDWLLNQPWVAERWPDFHQVIINYGSAPADTPEHNQMQAMFLDDAWCLALVGAIYPGFIDGSDARSGLQARAAGLDGWPVDETARKDWEHIQASGSYVNVPATVDLVSFESHGWDVVFTVTGSTIEIGEHVYGSHRAERFYVELKPDLGDDYPAVLRQVHSLRNEHHPKPTSCVVVRRAAFGQVTWEQVTRIFASSKIRLLAESQL